MTELYIRRLAVVMGMALLVGEVFRRWNTTSAWTFWMAHTFVAAPLLYGAWLQSRDRAKGLSVLAAAWGFSAGILTQALSLLVEASSWTGPRRRPA